jgi:hypothetical protein
VNNLAFKNSLEVVICVSIKFFNFLLNKTLLWLNIPLVIVTAGCFVLFESGLRFKLVLWGPILVIFSSNVENSLVKSVDSAIRLQNLQGLSIYEI